VKLSKFSDDTHAFAMFTMRTVGSEDPAHPDAPRKIDGGGMAALGIGNAYLWRGPYLAEILYNDPSASVGAITKQADTLLPAFVKTLGEKLPGDKSLPAAAALLPGEHRLPLGVRYVTKNLLYVDGVGPGAYGFYQNGTARWRVVSAIREHWEATHQTLVAIREDWKGKAEKGIGEAAVLAVQEASGADGEWLIARQGRYLLGVGDEPRVLRAGMPIDERQKKTLSREAKRELLAKLLAPLAQAKTPPSP